MLSILRCTFIFQSRFGYTQELSERFNESLLEWISKGIRNEEYGMATRPGQWLPNNQNELTSLSTNFFHKTVLCCFSQVPWTQKMPNSIKYAKPAHRNFYESNSSKTLGTKEQNWGGKTTLAGCIVKDLSKIETCHWNGF